MKKIFSANIALIGTDVLEHPSTIYTNEDVTVVTFDNVEALNTHIAQQAAATFPALPAVGQWCEQNKVYQYGEKIAKCIQSHNRMHYTLEETPALWLVITPTGGGYPDWVQPTGAHDAYQIGDRVRFNSKNYESKINANVWSPTAYPQGWQLIN